MRTTRRSASWTAPAATAVDGATDVDVVDNPTDSVGTTDTATGMTGTPVSSASRATPVLPR